MIRLNQIKLPVGYTEPELANAVYQALRLKPKDVAGYTVIKRSLDSRNKQLKYVLSVGVELKQEKQYLAKNKKADIYNSPIATIDELLIKAEMPAHPVIIGMGPAGLFAGLTLAKAGHKPIIFERGEKVEDRQKSVDEFIASSVLDTESNIQFGEGGAGTFSDGKLNTGTSSDKINVVLHEFAKYGAPFQIVYEAKPHIGTDKLREVVKNMREDILRLGGEIYFNSKLVDIRSKNGVLQGVEIETKDKGRLSVNCTDCILAIGHSARDTFEMLAGKILMTKKPFSIGVRIEHLQDSIDHAQYGVKNNALPPADYKLACHLDSGRSCYTFCMCPGGYVMPATSEENAVVTNGMSYFSREGKNANSALLVGVEPSDFGSDNVLAGVEFQRKYERLAYSLSGSYKAPCQRYGDFLKKKITNGFGDVLPTYPIGVTMAKLSDCLPDYVYESIGEAVKIFDNKLKGFASEDALLTGVESRSSSPVRMVRDEAGDSSIKGLMPCGEGAGYAGGITSASVDGITAALRLLQKYAK